MARQTVTIAIRELRANWLAIILLPLAARTAWTAWNTPFPDIAYTSTSITSANDPAMGFMLAFALYIFGAAGIGRPRLCKIALVLPFFACATYNGAYIVWHIFIGDAEFGVLAGMGWWCFFLPLLIGQTGWTVIGFCEGLRQQPTLPSEPETTVAHAKWASGPSAISRLGVKGDDREGWL